MSRKVIIADDSQSILEGVKESLEIRGFETSTAENGQIALELVEKGLPDLLITDGYMPVMGGLGLVKQLASRNYTFPIIFYSGDVVLTEAFPSCGYRGNLIYVEKPFFIELMKRVEELFPENQVDYKRMKLKWKKNKQEN